MTSVLLNLLPEIFFPLIVIDTIGFLYFKIVIWVLYVLLPIFIEVVVVPACLGTNVKITRVSPNGFVTFCFFTVPIFLFVYVMLSFQLT